MDTTWAKVLSEFELEVSKAVFLTLFKNTALISVNEGVATIQTPSPIVSSLIERRYYGLLQKLLKKYLAKDISIVFTSSGGFKGGDEKKSLSLPLFGEYLFSSTHQQRLRKARLRLDFTFEQFAVSSSNQLAYASSIAVAQNLGTSYNPLFFYGSVGVGKTHLMQAIGHQVLSQYPEKKVLYLTSEDFTNDFIDSIRSKNMTLFRKRLRNADLFLLDDVQFLAGKEKVQEELFHTFNSLIGEERQIVFSSDRPPQELEKIEKRLRSRFTGGLTVDIAPPDLELRCAILLIKAKKKNINISMEIARLIAQRIFDTRGLEGIVNRFLSEVNQNGNIITEGLAMHILGEEQNDKLSQKRLSLEDVLSLVCQFYKLKPTQLKGPKRDRHLVIPRHILMYLLKTELKRPLSEIGNFLGGRDHTTVMHGVAKIEKTLSSSGEVNINRDIVEIKKTIWG